MARKKIVFVIVEGKSDEEALGLALTKIFDKQKVHVHIMHGDITTSDKVTPDTVVAKLGNEIRAYAEANHFTEKDFQEIIHVVDTDGAYIPEDRIIEDISASGVIYSPTEIRAKSKSAIEKRNQQKKGNINKLISCKRIWKVPYRIFYMSCNLDHVLYDKMNTSDKEKEENSYRFAVQYRDRVQEFKAFFSDSVFSVVTGYKESWTFVKQDLHSLERHTNFALCFPPDSSGSSE